MSGMEPLERELGAVQAYLIQAFLPMAKPIWKRKPSQFTFHYGAELTISFPQRVAWSARLFPPSMPTVLVHEVVRQNGPHATIQWVVEVDGVDGSHGHNQEADALDEGLALLSGWIYESWGVTWPTT